LSVAAVLVVGSESKLRSQAHAAIAGRGAATETKLANWSNRIGQFEQMRTQIADRIVRMHDGSIRALNAADGGLIVEMTLPTRRK